MGVVWHIDKLCKVVHPSGCWVGWQHLGSFAMMVVCERCLGVVISQAVLWLCLGAPAAAC